MDRRAANAHDGEEVGHDPARPGTRRSEAVTRPNTRYRARPSALCLTLLVAVPISALPSAASAVDYDDTAAYCEALFEVTESELAEDLAAGDITEAEAALEREEMPSLEQCVCHWDMTREHAGEDYARRIQTIWLEGATLGELQEMDEQGLLDFPAGVDEARVSELIESTCGI